VKQFDYYDKQIRFGDKQVPFRDKGHNESIRKHTEQYRDKIRPVFVYALEGEQEMKLERRYLGLKNRGCLIDPITRQSVVTAKHTGDIVYPLQGPTSISNKSEYITPSRERTLNPTQHLNLNEVGENKNIFKRVPDSRYVRLD